MKRYVDWLYDTFIRMIKTAGAAAGAAIAGATIFSEVNWAEVGSIALMAAILTFLMNLDSLPERADKESIEDELEVIKDDNPILDENGELVPEYGDDTGEDNPTS